MTSLFTKLNLGSHCTLLMLGAAGFEPVRQVAVDEGWSALRFRRAEFIKTLARHPAGAESALGRARAQARRKSG
ncbi:MAG: hypothetical protein C4K60_01035 [Ideonella sp. MAG2]|nr:MAG: hypothetical protein C4K60_01035 [Ideonella sp. MAG2]